MVTIYLKLVVGLMQVSAKSGQSSLLVGIAGEAALERVAVYR